MLEAAGQPGNRTWFCNICAHDWREGGGESPRYRSLEEFIRQTGVTRAELVTLAEIGALNGFGYHRREALWQIERAVRPAGELFEEQQGSEIRDQGSGNSGHPTSACPLSPMTPIERVVADYEGTGLTLGPHPMALRRAELALRGVLRATDLPRCRHGRRVRIAGAVITRQRPGTARGFVFLTLEDETGIANVIVRPELFAREKLAIIEEPFLLVEGALQNQAGVTSVRAEQVGRLDGTPVAVSSHDFY
jgi:error-prone DNA polymerase